MSALRVTSVDAFTPPVFLWEPQRGAPVAVPSPQAAARRLRPWQEVATVAAYDATGRRVSFSVARRRGRLLGILPRWRDVVVVAGVEPSAAHAADLRRGLVAALAPRWGERAALEALPLDDLVARASAALAA